MKGKKIFAFVSILAMGVTIASPPLLAAAMMKKDMMMADYSSGQKLGRGFVNVLTSAGEIPRAIYHASTVKGPIETVFVGAHYGVGQMMARILAGAYDIVTFPIDVRKDGRAPIMHPEYLWDSAPKETHHYV
jgi:putative exosortase-associated protein (TIGR04073 family)